MQIRMGHVVTVLSIVESVRMLQIACPVYLGHFSKMVCVTYVLKIV